MGAVHASRGPLAPASRGAEVARSAMVCGLAEATVPASAASRGPSSATTTGGIRQPSAAWCPARATTPRRSTGQAASSSHARRTTPGLPDRGRQGASSPSTRSTCCDVPGGPAAAADAAQSTTSSTPRSTASRTATAASTAAGGSSSSTRDDIADLGLRRRWIVDIVSEWKDGSERVRAGFRSCRTTRRAATPLRTTRRRTRWYRWTPRRSAATARRRSR